MKNKNTKQITKKLGLAERYNACPRCGSEVYLYVDEEGEYCVGCVHCEEHNTSTYLTFVPGKDEIDTCRMCWNTWTTSSVHSPNALDKLKVRNGEYILTDASDGFIVFSGGKNEMFNFLKENFDAGNTELYIIHNVQNGRMYNIGLSHLVELVLKHFKLKQ